MRTTLIDHPRLNVIVNTGSEGPAHDPYHFTETIVTQPEGRTVLHEGLGTWIKAGGRKLRPPRTESASWCRSVAFVTLTGFKLEQLERIHRKLKSRCSECGGKEFESASGYPGEHFEICCRCKNVHNTSFNISEVE